MKPSLAFLIADLKDEWAKLERLNDEWQAIQAKLGFPVQLEQPDMPTFEKAAIGYYLHSFYNGCENIFRSIARFFENDVAPSSWHSDLLKRMKLEIPGIRPALIDEELFYLLEDFRGFRHKFRYSYSFELDWVKERIIVAKFSPAFEKMKNRLDLFIDVLTRMDD